MYGSLPRPLASKSGFQGCIASFETNGELEDPIKHALVPSPMVEEGCEGKSLRAIRGVATEKLSRKKGGHIS